MQILAKCEAEKKCKQESSKTRKKKNAKVNPIAL
jgi:hypothetical protein